MELCHELIWPDPGTSLQGLGIRIGRRHGVDDQEISVNIQQNGLFKLREVGERTHRQRLAIDLRSQSLTGARDFLVRLRMGLPQRIQHLFEPLSLLRSSEEPVRSDPIHTPYDAFSQGWIEIVSYVDQIAFRDSRKIPQRGLRGLFLKFPETPYLQELCKISFGHPTEIDVGIDMDHYSIPEPGLLPRIIRIVVILHHHDLLDRLDPDEAALSCRGDRC